MRGGLEKRYDWRMVELNAKQRKLLEKHAQKKRPLVVVGKEGVTEPLERMVARCLSAHELVKVGFNNLKDQKMELSERIAEYCGAALVRVIGNKAIFYRPSKKIGGRKYEKALSKLERKEPGVTSSPSS